MQFHGNYCGPGWTGGGTGRFDVPAISGIDSVCRDHDYNYTVMDEIAADVAAIVPALSNIKEQPLLSLGLAGTMAAKAALGVRLQPSAEPELTSNPFSIPGIISGLFDMGKGKGKKQKQKAPPTKAPKPASKPTNGAGTSTGNSVLMAPTALGSTLYSTSPTYRHRGTDLEVSQSLFWRDVNGSVAFTNQLSSLPFPMISPANSTMFATIAPVAMMYEQYKVLDMTIMYRNTCPTSATGGVVLACDYDADDDPITDKVTCLQLPSSQSGSPWAPLQFKVDTKAFHSLNAWKSICGPTGGNGIQDSNTLSGAKAVFGTFGQADTSVIGELWISVKFLLRAQHVPNDFWTYGSGKISAAVAAAEPWNNTVAYRYKTTQGVATSSSWNPFSASGATIQFWNMGEYIVVVNCNGTNPVLTVSGASTATCTLIADSNAAAECISTFKVMVTAPLQTLALTVGGTLSGNSATYIGWYANEL